MDERPKIEITRSAALALAAREARKAREVMARGRTRLNWCERLADSLEHHQGKDVEFVVNGKMYVVNGENDE